MKPILLVVFIFMTTYAFAQPYALLDKNMIAPAKYSKTFSVLDKSAGYFPIEKKSLNLFIHTLKEIAKTLSSPSRLKSLEQYHVGCVKFEGQLIPLDKGDKIDYQLTSTCGGSVTKMHLVDLRLNRENNLYFVNTWIKYIQSTLK